MKTIIKMSVALALIISAIVAAVAGTGGAMLTNRANRKAQEDINAQNLSLYQQQMQYNSPMNQVSMLRQAGLSPALFYGGGSGSMRAPNLPDLEAPEIENPVNPDDYRELADAWLNKQITEKEITLKEKQADATEAMTLKTLIETKDIEEDVWLKSNTRAGNIKKVELYNKEKEKQIGLLTEQINQLIQNIEHNKSMNPLLLEEKRESIHKLSAEIDKIIQETESEKERTKLIEFQAKGQKLSNEFQEIINKYQDVKSVSEINNLNLQARSYLGELRMLGSRIENEQAKAWIAQLQAMYESEVIQANLKSVKTHSKAEQFRVVNELIRTLLQFGQAASGPQNYQKIKANASN